MKNKKILKLLAFSSLVIGAGGFVLNVNTSYVQKTKAADTTYTFDTPEDFSSDWTINLTGTNNEYSITCGKTSKFTETNNMIVQVEKTDSTIISATSVRNFTNVSNISFDFRLGSSSRDQINLSIYVGETTLIDNVKIRSIYSTAYGETSKIADGTILTEDVSNTTNYHFTMNSELLKNQPSGNIKYSFSSIGNNGTTKKYLYIDNLKITEAEPTIPTTIFDANGGNWLNETTKTVTQENEGDTVKVPENPEYEGYSFAGWYDSTDATQTIVDSVELYEWNKTYKAKWDINQYDVTFTSSINGADNMPATQTVDHGNKVVEPTTEPTLEGYDFAGWYVGDTKYDFNKSVTGELALTAKWNKYFTITVNEETKKVYESTGTYTLPVLADNAETGEMFVGWIKNGETETIIEPGEVIVSEGDVFTPKYEVVGTVTVSYYDGESLLGTSGQILKGTSVTKPEDPTKDGFKFKEWVDAEGKPFDFNSTIDTDTSLYADWYSKVTVTFEGADVEDTTVYYENDKVTRPADPVKEGHKFSGWYVGEDLYDFDTPLTEDITITAKWNELIYAESITIDGGDFTWDDVETPKTLTATIDTKGDTVNTNPVVTWSSSNEKVVTINSSTGTLTHVGIGTSEITAKIYAGTAYEKTDTITITVTKQSYKLCVDFAQLSEKCFPIEPNDTKTKESSKIDFDGNRKKTFNGFTVILLKPDEQNVDGNDTKWNTKNSDRGLSLMTNGQIVFTASMKGTLNITWYTTKETRQLYVNGTPYTHSYWDKKPVTYENKSIKIEKPGEVTIGADVADNKTDNKIWYQKIEFVPEVETWVDCKPLIAAQKGTVNEKSAARFIGIIDKNAISFLENAWFVVNAIDENGEYLIDNHQTTAITTVYKSIVYTGIDGETVNWKYTNEVNPSAEYYYFAWTLYGIPEDFKGTITAQAFVSDGTNNIVSQVVSLEY